MATERLDPSSSRVGASVSKFTDPRPTVVVVPLGPKPALNVSVQTGEEFSLEFMKEHGALRNTMSRTELSGKMKRYALPAYEDLTGILGLRRLESGSESSDYSSFIDDRELEVENEGFPLSQGLKYKDAGERSPSILNVKPNLSGAVSSLTAQPYQVSKSACSTRQF